MNEQIIILIFLIIGTIGTLYLYILKAKKEVEYKRDERWLLIQNKARNITSYLGITLIVLLLISQIVISMNDFEIAFTFNRFSIICIIIFGCRNVIELAALKYYDKQL